MKPVHLICVCVVLASGLALAQSNPVPLVNEPLVPMTVAPGGPSFTLTLNGTGFVSGAVVSWNGTALTTQFISNSRLTATVPAAKIAIAQTSIDYGDKPHPGWRSIKHLVPHGVGAYRLAVHDHPLTADGWRDWYSGGTRLQSRWKARLGLRDFFPNQRLQHPHASR